MNLSVAFRKLVDETFIRYNGCLIERSTGGFMALGKFFPSLTEAKAYIDQSFSNIQNSLQ